MKQKDLKEINYLFNKLCKEEAVKEETCQFKNRNKGRNCKMTTNDTCEKCRMYSPTTQTKIELLVGTLPELTYEIAMKNKEIERLKEEGDNEVMNLKKELEEKELIIKEMHSLRNSKSENNETRELDLPLAFAIVVLAETGLCIGMDYCDKFDFENQHEKETVSIGDIRYTWKQKEFMHRELFHASGINQEYIKQHGRRIKKETLIKAIETLLDEDDTTVVIQEAMDMLMNDLSIEFKKMVNIEEVKSSAE